jgi:L-amino acid N-acyltransferase YncA
MLPDEIKNHREVVTLKDGVRVLLRPTTREDGAALLEYFSHVSDEDMRYMRHNVKDPAIVKGWCENLNYAKILPIVAIVKDRVVGSASLRFYEGPKRHIAEIRLFLAKDFRQRGLGMKMTRSMIDMARKQDVRVIVAEIIAEKTKVVRAFEQVGFVNKCLLEDYFMFPDGETCDVILQALYLKPRGEEF